MDVDPTAVLIIPECMVCETRQGNLIEHLWGHHKAELIDTLSGLGEAYARREFERQLASAAKDLEKARRQYGRRGDL